MTMTSREWTPIPQSSNRWRWRPDNEQLYLRALADDDDGVKTVCRYSNSTTTQTQDSWLKKWQGWAVSKVLWEWILNVGSKAREGVKHSLALGPTFGIHSQKTLDTAQPGHILKPNRKPSPSQGAGIAQWLEHRTRDWKVAGSNPCWNGGRIFFSRVDFLCWLLFRYPFHPRVTAVARKKSRSFCQKVQVAGYS